MTDVAEALDQEFDPTTAMTDKLRKTVLANIATVCDLEDRVNGFFLDFPDGTAGRTISGPTVTRDRQQQTEAKRAKQTAGSKLTWRLMLESATADVIAEAEEKILRARLVQLAALSVAWVEAIDRRKDEKRIARLERPSAWSRFTAWLVALRRMGR